MEIFYGIENFAKIQKCGTCVSVGTFDGLHIGHRLILQTLVQTAQAKGLKSLVLTFDPHPRKVLFPEKDLNLILSPEEKIEMFAATGVDYLVIHPFTKDFAAVSSSDFMDNVMVRQLGIRVEIVECDIVRDEDGLAKSSRNTLLAPDERAIAPTIYKALKASVTYAKKHTVQETHDKVVGDINKVDGLDVEYFSIVDGNTLQDITSWDDSPYVVGCITVYCGKTPIRLIDHIKYKS